MPLAEDVKPLLPPIPLEPKPEDEVKPPSSGFPYTYVGSSLVRPPQAPRTAAPAAPSQNTRASGARIEREASARAPSAIAI
jgi:hypothetical protein